MSPVRKKHAFWLLAILLAAGIGWYFSGAGNIPLVSLNPTNFNAFRMAFIMRHADIRTTMNIYGDVVTDEMAQAHSKVVRIALAKVN